MREKRRHGDAARARAPDVDVLAAGDVAHHIHGFFQGPDIGVDSEMAFGGGRVLPADGEDLQVSLEAIANDALFRREIENVELVDLRRGGEQRPGVYLFSPRPVLD